MKKYSTALLIFVFIALSSALYLVQLAQFRDPRDTLFYLLQDLAFLPIQIALVTIALGRLIRAYERRERLQKTNMMVSAFFSELGTELMGRLALCGNFAGLGVSLRVEDTWSPREFRAAADSVRTHALPVNCVPENLTELKKLLAGKRMFLLVMLSNPALMEHQSFTDMLFALFHLTDELLARERLDDLPEADLEHLNRDVNRVLRAVLIHWVGYLRHIQADYPYLFSLELRRNPFRAHAEINFPGPSDIH